MTQRSWLALIAAVGMLSALACAGPDASAADASRPTPRPAVAADRPAATLPPLAVVVPRATIELSTGVAGTLRSVDVALGQHVGEGQPLVALANEDLALAIAEAEATAAAARSRVHEAKQIDRFARDRAQRSRALAGIASADDLRQLDHEAHRLVAATQSADGARAAEDAVLARLRARRDALVVRAPFAGEIAALHHELGQPLAADAPLVRLVSAERLIRFAVPATAAAGYAPASTVLFISDVDGSPTPATVITRAPTIDAAGLVLHEAIGIDAVLPAAGTTGRVVRLAPPAPDRPPESSTLGLRQPNDHTHQRGE